MRASRGVWLGRLALAGPIAFTIAWLVGGLVQDEYSPRQEDISALAALDAQHAWIMITGFVLLGVGTVALAAGLASTLRYPSAVIGSILLVIAGIGLMVAGLARNDCSSELPACAARVDAGEVSWHHEVHDNVSLIIFLALIAAPLVLARAFGRDDHWRPLRAYSIVTGLLGFALLVLYVIAPAGTWNGLVQRIFVSVLFLWIAVLGLRLARVEHVATGPNERLSRESSSAVAPNNSEMSARLRPCCEPGHDQWIWDSWVADDGDFYQLLDRIGGSRS